MTHLKDYLLEVYNQKTQKVGFDSWHENMPPRELAYYFRIYIDKISVSNIQLSRVAECLLDNQ